MRNTEEPVWKIDWKPEDPKKSGMIFAAKFGKPAARSIVAAGAGENQMKIFCRDTNDVVASVQGTDTSIYSLDVNEEGDMMAFGSADGLLNVLDFNEADVHEL